ncbi:MAG: hypothetical protein JXR13_14380 [Thalassovita sp.]
MSSERSKSIWGAIWALPVTAAAGLCVWLIEEFDLLGRAVDKLSCDGVSEYQVAQASIADLFANGHSYVPSILLEKEKLIVENIVAAAGCGHIEAQVSYVGFTCEGDFGFEENMLETLKLINGFEQEHNFDAETSPFRMACAKI